MADSSSSKKVQRAARTSAASKSTRERRELGFPLALVAVVILGVALVAFARASRSPAEPPRVGNDHWHSAYGIYDCDRFLPAFTSAADPDGIHSHQDGVVHIHPWNSSASGDQARMDVFFEAMGARVTDDEISGPGIGVLEAGSDCNGEPTVIRVVRFNQVDPDPETFAEGEAIDELTPLYEPADVYTDDFGDVRLLNDLEAFTIARVPADAEIPPPPEDRLQTALGASAGNLISAGPETDLDPTDTAPEE
ncbi:MAG: hypothetical protein OXE79_09835 [Acidimicrobiaceae bacterium]|nr:hypothetical protein [Acidimicrobiaceae bacterium]MCY4175173.1 hypothetical protein [Acidimicrobiaceae bacterium]MCY4281209.1 hypothetical protein [Acidimicrobiaceae bacterium]MCY4294720.1 hypothetical protein [Acidimicrobiaceae bacterium]